MRTKLLFISLTLFFCQSYSQEFDEKKIDFKLQKQYADTLRSIGEKLTGKWKYLGKRNSGNFIDTLGTMSTKGVRSLIIVANGEVFKVTKTKKKRADFYYEIIYDFKGGRSFYSMEEKYLNEDISSFTTCHPIPELIFYEGKFGILFVGMGGQSFQAIRELKAKKLLFENEKEYLKME